MSSSRSRAPFRVRLSAALIAAAPSVGLAAQDAGLDFAEEYALADDRAKVVERLPAGSEDWYEYTCRVKQAAGDLAAVDELLNEWIKAHGRTPQVLEVETRQALLGFERDPAATYAFLRERLGLRFDDERAAPGARSELPSSLDPALLTREAWSERARKLHPRGLDGFQDSALLWLAGTQLSDDDLGDLLERLKRPDVPGLVELVVRDLTARKGRAFGSRPVHKLLRIEQLEQCAFLHPPLLQEASFVAAWLERLRPDADSAWLRDPAERRAQLERLWAFARRLPPVHNSLRAHVLYHFLELDLAEGALDKERFLAYLRLPRRSRHVIAAYRERFQTLEEVDLAASFDTGLPPIGDDEALVRACLERLFATEDAIEPYADFLEAGWLRLVLAETRLLAGDPDPLRWYALLADHGGPARVEELAQRVEITFPRSARRYYAAAEPVTLEVDVKNVPALLVKVFAIDAYRYMAATGREVDESIDLEGLVANFEETLRFDEPPMRRVRRRLELPMLAQPGTFVVELVGNGQSSRAVIEKGFLRHVEAPGAAGHLFKIFDEAGERLSDATLWLGGREYRPDERGEILVPFTENRGMHTTVLRHGERATLARFFHERERYELQAPWHVDREALIAGARARIVLRPSLLLADRPVALKLLSEPVLTVTATDQDGLATTEEVRGLVLEDERELVHEISVPERLARLTVSLRGVVEDLAGERVELATAPESLDVNDVDATEDTSSVQLLRSARGYALELRGKDGEPKAGRPLALSFWARDFTDSLDVTLQTDAAGRIELGALPDITRISVPLGNMRGEIALGGEACAYPPSLHGAAGATLRVPYQGAATAPTRAAFSFLAHDRDAFGSLALAGGFLELRDLAPGDYELVLHETGTRIAVRVARARADGGYWIGAERMLEATPERPLHVVGIQAVGEELVVQLANASPSTRVAVVATRYVPPFDLFQRLASRAASEALALDVEPAPSTYHSGRTLSDEYRYVLERRFAPRFPGNMLQRPSLLLNPWDVDSADLGAVARTPSTSVSRRGRKGAGGRGGGGASAKQTIELVASGLPGAFANVDWLPRPSAMLANVVPDMTGLVRVPLAALGDGQLVHVLALDGEQAVYDTLARDEKPLAPRARHLSAALDPSERWSEARRIEFVPAGGSAVIDTARTAAATRLDSLAAVHRLLLSISADRDLAAFEFVTRWPSLAREEQLELYARHACHELHFFLHEKDPAFFAEVVRPFLENKLHKTFLDHWLLGHELGAYLEPWAFSRLCLIERLLLVQRLGAAERAAAARLVREELELSPPDPARLRRLFELALSSNALSEPKGAAAPASPPPPSPPAPGPAGESKTQDEGGETPPPQPEAGESSELVTYERDSSVERAEDAERRAHVRGLYKSVEPTRRLIEHDYWHRSPRADDSFARLVPASAFWRDYAEADLAEPFVSSAVAQASGSFLEMMFALSVLDLPFAPAEPELATDGTRTTLRAATPLLLVRRETAPVAAADEPSAELPLLLGESFLRLDDRTVLERGKLRDKPVMDEFLTDVAYVCQVVVTNPTSSERVVELLLQIPAGALPVLNGFWTRGRTVELGRFSTEALEYAFYFPRAGDFAHYPVHASEHTAEGERFAGAAEARTLHVVDAPSRVDATSWEEISQRGSSAEVLAYLDGANVQRLDLARIAWRLREKSFFEALIAKLRARHVYSHAVWSYGLFHEDAAAAREYLEHDGAFVASCGAYLDSPLLSIDPYERAFYKHIELDPLVHARAHKSGSLGAEQSAELLKQYRAFLDVVGYRPRLDPADWAMATYYLLLADRVQEALEAFARIRPEELASRLQHDYLSAYLCFFTGDVARARSLAEPYRDHPVAHWRERFAAVLSQIDEAEGKDAGAAGGARADRLAASEPALELAADAGRIVLRYANLEQCELRFYALDVEMAFSAQPFAPADGAAAAFVQPTLRRTVELPASAREIAVELPPELATANVRVEARAGGLSRSRTVFAHALDVRFLESLGQVAVAGESGAPLSKVYVKCFARLADGSVRFHKDGYTDLRGRFDYVSVSNDPDLAAERFAVLVLSDELGADVRELAPPAR